MKYFRCRRTARLRFLILVVGLGIFLILFVIYTLTSRELFALHVGEVDRDEESLGDLAPLEIVNQEYDTMRHNRSPKFVKGQALN